MRLTYALIFAMFVQAGAIFVWIGDASARLKQAETQLGQIQRSELGERLARLEAHMIETRHSLQRIEARITTRQPGDRK